MGGVTCNQRGESLRNRGRADNTYRPFSPKSYLTLIMAVVGCGKIEYDYAMPSVIVENGFQTLAGLSLGIPIECGITLWGFLFSR